MAERYIPLGGILYFDTKDRTILRKNGERFVFMRHDRRNAQAAVQAQWPVKYERRNSVKEARRYKSIGGGLYWSEELGGVFKKSGENFLLYSRNRRKSAGAPPDGVERRRPVEEEKAA
jgi:hypothetical protein